MVVLIHFGWLLAGAALSRALRDPLALRVVSGMLPATLVATSMVAVPPQ